MAKLTKQQRKEHAQAQGLLRKDPLSEAERETIFKLWNPASDHDVGSSGSFFTPFDLAADFRIDAGNGRIIDLCAGIGMLGYWCLNFPWDSQSHVELVCIEINPAFVEIGKKLLPQATWICANVFDVPELNLGHFDMAIANPPFGRVNRHGHTAPRYSGSEFSYHVIDIASDLADYGAFIIPQSTAPFRYSGVPCYERQDHRAYKNFQDQTAIELDAGVGIDTSQFRDQWKGTRPAVEIVCADFTEARTKRIPDQHELFDLAA